MASPTSAGWATGLESVGRITGLASAVLLLAQVVLMARVPVLERAFGQDELARIHRLVGFTTFNLVLAHLVTITWGYAGGSLTATPGTLWDLVVNYPGMLLATAATVCLVMVVVTSVRAARRTAALRVVAPDAPLRVPRRRTRDPAPAVDRRRLHLLDRPPGLLVVRVDRRRRQRAGVAGRTAAVAQPAPRPPRRRRRPGGRRDRLGPRHRPAPPPPPGRGRPVLHLALRRTSRPQPRQPLLPVRRPRRPLAADHRPGRRRRQRRDRRSRPSARAPGSRARTAG